MEKAIREAGLRTTWTDPDPAYERAVADLVGRAYADEAFLAELEALVAEIAPGRVKAAALALLRLTSPGVPDTYQGTETEQLVLVDPDNRRPAPFTSDDSLKFRVTRTTLRLRRDHPDLFTGYRPLDAPDHLVAFTRGNDRLAVVATRLTPPATTDRVEGPAGRVGGVVGAEEVTGWVDLPAGPWHDLLSDTDHPGPVPRPPSSWRPAACPADPRLRRLPTGSGPCGQTRPLSAWSGRAWA